MPLYKQPPSRQTHQYIPGTQRVSPPLYLPQLYLSSFASPFSSSSCPLPVLPHTHINLDTLLIFFDLPFHFLTPFSFTFFLNFKVIDLMVGSFVLSKLTHINLSDPSTLSSLSPPLLPSLSFLCFFCLIFFPTVCFKIKFLPELCYTHTLLKSVLFFEMSVLANSGGIKS